jgi:17beta-estradiol 17-dehydrogenase / very-long-chain 3-oxoacyl-CoA reductase
LDYGNAVDQDFNDLQEKCSKLNITVLINNAGVSHTMPTPFVQESRETLNQIIQVNCTSTIQVTRSILPSMIKNKTGGGLILNMGSVSAELKTPLLQTYAGSKAFLSVWSQALAEEVSEYGIHVELLNTHFVTTNMSKIRRSSWTCPTPKSYVSCVLNKCGNGYFSTLYPGHAIIIAAMSLIPNWILRSLTLKQMKATRKHALAKAARTK